MRRSAKLPWEASSAKRGRPKKEPAERQRVGCEWPVRPAGPTCGNKTAEGLLLCPAHATVLDEPPGTACAWPDCSQTAPFRSLCSYHGKRALGLLEAAR